MRQILFHLDKVMKISIIICAYNEEERLARCIDSVIAQTYRNWELWVINDGSIDSTAKIVQEYAAQDHRIHLHSQENQGLSSARKSGIRCAQGEYLTFIDADDYVGELYLEHLLETLSHFPEAECIKGGFLQYKQGRVSSICASETSQFPPVEAITLSYHRNSIWAVLWKTSFLKQHFESIPEHLNFAEDLITDLLLYPHLKSVCFSPYADYHYLIHGSNMTFAQHSPKEFIRVLKEYMGFANQDYWKRSVFVYQAQYYLISLLMQSILRSTASDHHLITLLQQLPSPLLSLRFFRRSLGFGTYFYTWLLKHKLYRLFLYLGKRRFE